MSPFLHRTLLLLSALGLATTAACAASPTGGGRPGEGGGAGGMTADSGPSSAVDTGVGPGPTADAGGVSTPGTDAGCDQTVPIEVQIVGDPPDVLLVVDRSGSMIQPVSLLDPFGQNKWQAMREALRNVVSGTDLLINYGLMLFPGAPACGAGQVMVEVGPRQGDAVTARLNMSGPQLEGATPTHTSVDAARAYFAGIEENPAGQFVVLATDGEPNCFSEAMADVPTPDETVAAVANLAAENVRTYVIGFGDAFAGDPTTLMRMAMAGGTGSHFTANSPASLEDALRDIAADIIPPSCSFELVGDNRNPDLLRIDLDGDVIPRDPAHRAGWDYDPAANAVTFYGSACDRIQSGQVADVNVDFGCPGPLI